MIPRLHLFEFHDQSWFPASFRDGMTECLRMYAVQLELDRVTAPLISEVLRMTGSNRMVDLCSGACGPVFPLWRELTKGQPNLQVVVTDKHPNTEAFRRAESERDRK